jgi:hypothetical protein
VVDYKDVVVYVEDDKSLMDMDDVRLGVRRRNSARKRVYAPGTTMNKGPRNPEIHCSGCARRFRTRLGISSTDILHCSFVLRERYQVMPNNPTSPVVAGYRASQWH